MRNLVKENRNVDWVGNGFTSIKEFARVAPQRNINGNRKGDVSLLPLDKFTKSKITEDDFEVLDSNLKGDTLLSTVMYTSAYYGGEYPKSLFKRILDGAKRVNNESNNEDFMKSIRNSLNRVNKEEGYLELMNKCYLQDMTDFVEFRNKEIFKTDEVLNVETRIENISLHIDPIINISKLTAYIEAHNSGYTGFTGTDRILPDLQTIRNIDIMSKRLRNFAMRDDSKLENPWLYAIKNEDARDINYTAYEVSLFNSLLDFTSKFTSDFLYIHEGVFKSKDSLCLVKLNDTVTKQDVLELLMYYMSVNEDLGVEYLSILNPRTNDLYKIKISNIDETVFNNINWTLLGADLDSRFTKEHHFTFDKETGTILDYNNAGGLLVRIPETIDGVAVKSIGERAFYNKNLIRVVLPEGLEVIEREAFKNNHITYVEIPDSVEVVKHSAFMHNDLFDVKLGEGLKVIEDYVFFDNMMFAYLFLNKGLKSIGSNSFANNNYKNVYSFHDTVVEDDSFDKDVFEKIIRD